MSNFNQWKSQIDEWTKQEDTQEKIVSRNREQIGANKANLTLVESYIPRVCAKCGNKEGLIHRHHKGHEYLWARLLPSRYSKRYVEFRSSDIVCLCEKCHLKIHKLYEPRLYELWNILYLQDGKITYEQAERFRLKLIRCCDNWLKIKGKVSA